MSGGADYSEYLQRKEINEVMNPGQILGVYGREISLNKENVDHYMVVSTNPVLLGNMKDSNKLDPYEKVGFIGQVPARVLGELEIEDYILPSGNNYGLGIAKSIEQMSISDYSQIVGIAWKVSEMNFVNIVNVAIGLNAHHLAH